MCAEMVSGQPWSLQQDAHGVAACVHAMMTAGTGMATLFCINSLSVYGDV